MGSDGNVLQLDIFKVLFPKTTLEQLLKHKDKRVILCTYSNSCVPQMGVCKVNIVNKGIKYQCSYNAGPDNGPALLGMLDCERLQLLSDNCNTTDVDQKGGPVTQSKQDRSLTKQKFKN